MKRFMLVLLAALPTVPLASCAADYATRGGAYIGSNFAYDGFYDDYYGGIYDGYWGRNGGFYYRNGEHERSYRRGDGAHFNRNAAPGGNFHPMHGAMTPSRGVRTPHFDRSANRGR